MQSEFRFSAFVVSNFTARNNFPFFWIFHLNECCVDFTLKSLLFFFFKVCINAQTLTLCCARHYTYYGVFILLVHVKLFMKIFHLSKWLVAFELKRAKMKKPLKFNWEIVWKQHLNEHKQFHQIYLYAIVLWFGVVWCGVVWRNASALHECSDAIWPTFMWINCYFVAFCTLVFIRLAIRHYLHM